MKPSFRQGHLNALSIIVPMLNEGGQCGALFEHLHPWQKRGCDIILVDGGSTDGCLNKAHESTFRVIESKRGRALQMNAGAKAATGDLLIFLHADTRLSEAAFNVLIELSQRSRVNDPHGTTHFWGRFDVAIQGRSKLFPMISTLINWRSRLSGISTGDQAIFVSKPLLKNAGYFPEQSLMEDIELSKQLKKTCAPICCKETVNTSGRRWDQNGAWRTIWLMWKLRFRYWRGTSPETLAREYQ